MAKSKSYMASYRNAARVDTAQQLTPMQRAAKAEIARLEQEIQRLEAKPGVVEGQGINTFIRTSTQAMRDRQRIQGIRNNIAAIRETYNV